MSNFKRLKLSKKLFMSLSPGQYIMDNYFPQRYEAIGNDLANQWERWRSVNGLTVTIYDTQTECLQDWLTSTVTALLRWRDKALYYGKLEKKLFMDAPNGYYLLFTQAPFDHVEFQENRDEQWSIYSDRKGFPVQIFNNRNDCVKV